jgi:excisionase family DNA binding protein
MNDSTSTTAPTTESAALRTPRRRRRDGGSQTRPGIASDLVSVPDAAVILNVSPGTLRNWLSVRRLPYVKVGRLTRLSRRALDRYIATNTIDAVE